MDSEESIPPILTYEMLEVLCTCTRTWTPPNKTQQIHGLFFDCIFKYDPNPTSCYLFSSFSQYIFNKCSTKFDHLKPYLDGVLGIQTRDRGMVGADESTELWRLTLIGIFNCRTMVQMPAVAIDPAPLPSFPE